MPDDANTQNVTIELKIKLAGHPLNAKVTMPAGTTRPRMMLPIFQGLTNAVVGLAEEQMAANGITVSCKKGCGACCRQLVPISQVEARFLLEQMADMPPERRETIQARFDAARSQLEQAGLLEQLEHPERFDDGVLETLGLRYFAQRIACPFLEEESCSIHADRPLACREYLVTSPAERCANPAPEAIEPVELPGYVSKAVLHLGTDGGDRFTKWVPLIVSTHWAEQNPEPSPSMTGPDMLREVLGRLWGKPTGQPGGA